MKAYFAFFCGSLLSALISFYIANGPHIGRGITFIVLGTGSGLVLAVIGLVILFIASFNKDSIPEASTSKVFWCFFLPLIIVLGVSWLFSLQTSAN
jgi:nitrate reductase gamma subunit